MKKHKHTTHSPLLHLLLTTLYLLNPSLNVRVVVAGGESRTGGNPFTPKAYLIRYWKNHISNGLPKPWFLLNKASPMTQVQQATFAKLAEQNSLSTQLPAFCKSADLLCDPDPLPSLEENHEKDAKFTSYNNQNFSNYGTGRPGGLESFKKYDNDLGMFTRYSRDSSSHGDAFTSYSPGANAVDQSFYRYGNGAKDGKGDFNSYNDNINSPYLRFTSYSENGNHRKQSFKTYNNGSNGGVQSFATYGKNANGAENEFISYAKDVNFIGSLFSKYSEAGKGTNDTFKSYGFQSNLPNNQFKSYADGANGAVETFKSYREQSDSMSWGSFKSYARDSKSVEVKFESYATDEHNIFKGYAQNSQGQSIGFKSYGVGDDFKEYAQKGVSFAGYINDTSQVFASLEESKNEMVKNNKLVEPGRFFREKMLKAGFVMPMPDIRDKMPKRSFLPRAITSNLPFSTAKIGQLKEIFHAQDDPAMDNMLTNALNECERAPSPGETKKCVSSVEDMIDFAASVLGPNVVVRTTENTQGSNGNIMIGSVKGINGGKVTKSVSCHQSLFPYLLYYCHSVPKVRVYEADLLDPKTKAKVNHGVAICHIDTSAWSPTHGAFIALGSGPGKIEVCHWIFENDMTWTVAD